MIKELKDEHLSKKNRAKEQLINLKEILFLSKEKIEDLNQVKLKDIGSNWM